MKLIVTLTTLLFMTACGSSKIDDPKGEKQSSNVAVTETESKTTGYIAADGINPQTIVVGRNPDILDAAATFPPGALKVSTEVALQTGADQTSQVATALGIPAENVVGAKANPVNIDAAAANTLLVQPMMLTLPLPVTADSLAPNTALTSKARLVLLYIIRTETGYKAGIKPFSTENAVGTFMQVKMAGFGWFQIAYFRTDLEEKEISIDFEPKAKG